MGGRERRLVLLVDPANRAASGSEGRYGYDLDAFAVIEAVSGGGNDHQGRGLAHPVGV